MSHNENLDYTALFDEHGQLYGVLVSPALWEQLKDQADALSGTAQEPEPSPEPLQDWENLKASWDFKYPVDTDVHCEACGASTDDWLADDPRKFLLTAANFTGIVTFQCRQCRAKIIKRHFTDKLTVETRPYQETKTYKFDGDKGR